MSKEIIYIDYDEALNIYGKMIVPVMVALKECVMKAVFVLHWILCKTIYTILPLPTN